MAVIKNPNSFSDAFKIAPARLAAVGVLDPVLNVDTKLFIDPLLLPDSKHKEIREGATASYRRRFETIIKLLAGSKRIGDVAWVAARRQLTFPEIIGTCIGYGAASITGHSWGEGLREKVLQAAKEIVDLGVDDPDLFMVVALLEDGVGPDLISDMTTNLVLPDLEAFNGRILKALGVASEEFTFSQTLKLRFARNPLISSERVPVVLLPLDILAELPVASSWDDVGRAASENAVLRSRVNALIGAIWDAKVRRTSKERIRTDVYASKEAFQALLDTVRSTKRVPYDAASDPEGHFAWVRIHHTVATEYPLQLSLASPTLLDAKAVVTKIVEHFQDLIENKGLWKELWNGNSPRPEKSAQRIFFAVADAHCKANDLDISPEADSGAGPVDFKVSRGHSNRVLVEVKLSTNPKVVAGYEKQLEAYKKAEGTTRAIYLLIDVGGMGKKDERILQIKNAAAKRGEPTSDLVVVSGKKQKSASKR